MEQRENNREVIHNFISEGTPSIILLNQIAQFIEQFGVAIINVPETINTPPYSYTVGLVESIEHPEMIVFGLPADISSNVLNDIIEMLKATAESLQDGDILNDISNYPLIAKKVSNKHLSTYAKRAFDYFKTTSLSLEFFIIYWPDENTKYPWDSKFSESLRSIQPLFA